MFMDIPGLTAEAQEFIARKELGNPLQIYEPPTSVTILGGTAGLGSAAFVAYLFQPWLFFGHGANFPALVFSFLVIVLLICGLAPIFIAISNRKKRAVICMHGVAFLTSQGSVSFRWEDVLTTTRFFSSQKRFIYTVHCRNGWRIVFKNLSRIKDLAEAIDVHVARTKRP
jgi:hypothetical protein